MNEGQPGPDGLTQDDRDWINAKPLAPVAEVNETPTAPLEAVAEGSQPPAEAPRDGAGTSERRERRPRNRGGRDRAERGAEERAPREFSPQGEALADENVAPVQTAAAAVPEVAPIPSETVIAAPVEEPTVSAPTTLAQALAQPTTAASAPAPAATAALPVVQPFQLVVEELAEVAQHAGLVWVNSDADKIAAVQRAIAAEPAPRHVPRERPAPVQIDTGPLVLVETKRTLGQEPSAPVVPQ